MRVKPPSKYFRQKTMIKKCKWCGKESVMNGKREYCDKKCKKNYENAKRRGKLGKRELTNEQSDKIVNIFIAHLGKVTTTDH